MEVKIKKINKDAIVPTRGSAYAAGYDLYANCLPDGYIEIEKHKSVKIDTGLAMEIPNEYFGAIFARSGLATKYGLRPANCVAVIDSDYRGEWFIPLHNDTDAIQVVNHGDRIAQLIIMPYQSIKFEEISELSETDRGVGGFGSTGRN